MVTKINGKVGTGEFVGRDLDFYTVAMTADIKTANNTAIGYATGTLTFTGNAVAAETVTINGQVITFVANGATPTAGQVAVGTTEANSTIALAAYINANKAALGVTATSTTTTVVVTATTYGTAGNAITTTETMTAASWGGATLSGGVDEAGRAAAAYLRLQRIFDTISLNGQPILIGTIDETDATPSFTFAIEHTDAWQDGAGSNGNDAVLGADVARTTLATQLATIPGVSSVTVTRAKTLG